MKSRYPRRGSVPGLTGSVPGLTDRKDVWKATKRAKDLDSWGTGHDDPVTANFPVRQA